MPDTIDNLYPQHLNQLHQQYSLLMEQQGYETLLIAAGTEQPAFRDDVTYPFRANPYFKNWVPLTQAPGCFLMIEHNNTQPTLFFYQPKDYWHQITDIPQDKWAASFTIQTYSDTAQLKQLLPKADKTLAFIGEPSALPTPLKGTICNPESLLTAIDYQRAIKSEYEINCMRLANEIAVRGHLAAEKAYRAGGSEYEIHQAYLSASIQTDDDLPYPNIVALNEHACILHYNGLSRERPATDQSFFIDAGATFNGYAADISRTYTALDTALNTKDDSLFAELITAMDKSQQQLVAQAKPGLDYVELHLAAHRQLAEILVRFKLVECSAEACFKQGITQTFFPHGVGHLIGTQVHDRGGLLKNTEGAIRQAPLGHDALRLTRTLEAGYVVTIEPGLYFIPMLLDELRGSEYGKLINWAEVDALIPYGGIRIEDDVVIRQDHAENLTRQAFSVHER